MIYLYELRLYDLLPSVTSEQLLKRVYSYVNPLRLCIYLNMKYFYLSSIFIFLTRKQRFLNIRNYVVDVTSNAI